MIVGDGLDERIAAYADDLPSVRMVGWVPSLVPYYANTRICVVPLQYGAGTKRKLVQALWTGTPAVSTTVGGEGLGLRHGEHFLLADDPATFAASMSELLTDERRWQRIARAGHDHVAVEHGREAVGRRLGALVQRVLTQPAKPGGPLVPDEDRYRRRLRYQEHQRLLDPMRETVCEVIGSRTPVLVLNEEFADLLALGAVPTTPFPRVALDSDDETLVRDLESARAEGLQYLLIPRLAEDWLAQHTQFDQHVRGGYPIAARRDGVCVLFHLGASGGSSDGERIPPQQLTGAP
jgi:hypothetical protein